MKKKKGFTLVELLAVIVVLAVIALIAVPTVLGVIDKARRSSLQDSGYGLVEAANLYYAQYSPSKTVRFDIENNKITTEENNKLNYKGTVKNGTVLINNKGQITVCINDGKHAAYKNYQDTKVIVVDSKTCTVPESSYIVYLDGEKTITELTNGELKQEIENLKKEILVLKDGLNNIVTSESILKQVYPVGSIYISVDNTNPSELFGGTWEVYAENRMLLGTKITNESEQIGGNNIVTLSIDNIPGHIHSIPSLNGTALTAGDHFHSLGAPLNGSGIFNGWAFNYAAINATNINHFNTNTSGSHIHNVVTNASTTGVSGSGSSFSVQNPYITVYIWKRIK